MQPERQISIAFTGIAAVLVIPEYIALSHHQHATPGAGLVVGAVLGALGVFGGSLIVAGHSKRAARALGFGLCILIGLAFSGAALFGAVHSPSWGRRVVFGLAGLLPLVGPILVLTRHDRS